MEQTVSSASSAAPLAGSLAAAGHAVRPKPVAGFPVAQAASILEAVGSLDWHPKIRDPRFGLHQGQSIEVFSARRAIASGTYEGGNGKSILVRDAGLESARLAKLRAEGKSEEAARAGAMDGAFVFVDRDAIEEIRVRGSSHDPLLTGACGLIIGFRPGEEATVVVEDLSRGSVGRFIRYRGIITGEETTMTFAIRIERAETVASLSIDGPALQSLSNRISAMLRLRKTTTEPFHWERVIRVLPD